MKKKKKKKNDTHEWLQIYKLNLMKKASKPNSFESKEINSSFLSAETERPAEKCFRIY